MTRFIQMTILVTALVGSYSTLRAQDPPRVTRIVEHGSTGCVLNLDPNRPLPTQISGGILNGKALELPKPEIVRTPDGRKLHGKVSVQVVIGEDGTVISASGVSGDEPLKPAAESAALKARFAPTLLSGNPVKVSGLIWYKF